MARTKVGKRWLVFGMAMAWSGFFLGFFYLAPDSGGAWLHLIESKILDAQFRTIRRPLKPDPAIVIVTINDAAIHAMEPKYGRYPWPRRAIGEIVEYLHHVGARAVAIDILYPEKNLKDPAGDHFFAQQVAAAGNIILAANYPDTGETLLPFPELLAGTAATGGVDFTADPDGPSRRYRLLYPRPDHTPSGLAQPGLAQPGLALAVANFLKVPVAWDRLPLGQDNSYWIDWYGPQGQFTYLEAHKILAAHDEWKSNDPNPVLHPLAASFLKDKIVFVGVTATGLFDLRATPFSPIYPAIEIHATALSNLLHGDFIRPLPIRWDILYVLILALVTALGGSRLHAPLKEALFALGIFVVIGLIGTRSFIMGLWVPMGLPLITVGSIVASTILWNYLTTGREKRFIREAFARYLNEEVLEDLINHPQKLELGGENVNLTVLFSDIRNFTGLSESRQPHEVVALLNEYLTEMVDTVFQYHGTLDKFIGDAVMAFWGAPVKTQDHALQAVRAALDMLDKVKKLRTKWELEGKPSLHIGIGINTAEITVGNIGSERSQSYTVIGDGVNLASRLESLNKTYHTELIISESTYEQVKDKVVARFLEDVKVKGKEQSVKVYEVTSWKGCD